MLALRLEQSRFCTSRIVEAETLASRLHATGYSPSCAARILDNYTKDKGYKRLYKSARRLRGRHFGSDEMANFSPG